MKRTNVQILMVSLTVLLMIGCTNQQTTAENSTQSIHKHKRMVAIQQPKPKFVSASQIEEYVSRVGKKISIVSDYPEQMIGFNVSKDQTPDVSKSSERIQISRGMLIELHSEAELGALLAHQIAHAHGAASEVKADKMAMTYLSRAGLNPLAYVNILERLHNNQQSHQNRWNNQYLSQHPVNYDRILAASAYAKQLPRGLNEGRKPYQEKIAGLRQIMANQSSLPKQPNDG